MVEEWTASIPACFCLRTAFIVTTNQFGAGQTMQMIEVYKGIDCRARRQHFNS